MVKNVFIPKIVYRTCTKQIEVKLVAIDFEFNSISTYTRSFKKGKQFFKFRYLLWERHGCTLRLAQWDWIRMKVKKNPNFIYYF